jgi:hypothetical protein
MAADVLPLELETTFLEPNEAFNGLDEIPLSSELVTLEVADIPPLILTGPMLPLIVASAIARDSTFDELLFTDYSI